MATDQPGNDIRFNEAELTSISLLFERLHNRGIAPVTLYCIDSDGRPMAAFNPGFTTVEADLIGGVISQVLDYLNALRAE